MKTCKMGSVVVSTQGRDKNLIYIVLKVDNQKIWLINGKTRKLENPKLKNLKHIQVINENSFVTFENEKSINDCVINELKKYEII